MLRVDRKLVVATVVTTVTLVGACHTYVHSPPAQFATLESSRNLDLAQSEVHAELADLGELFGPMVTVVTLGGAHGVSRSLEIRGEARVAPVRGDGAVLGTLGTVRLGVGARASPHERQILKVTGGLGAGHSPTGGFVAPDLGLRFGVRVQRTEPLLNLTGFVSVPVTSPTVETSDGPRHARTTGGVVATAGVRVAVGRRTSAALPPIELGVGATGAFLSDGNRDENRKMFGVVVGVARRF